ERYLAYGAALGAAVAAVRAIPMGAENDRRAWSSYGGSWRQVTVSYPTVWPPAWGASPGETIWRGIRLGGSAGIVLFVFSLLLPRGRRRDARPHSRVEGRLWDLQLGDRVLRCRRHRDSFPGIRPQRPTSTHAHRAYSRTGARKNLNRIAESFSWPFGGRWRQS